MAYNMEDFVDVDIAKGSMSRSFACRLIGEGDNNGNRFGVRVYENGGEKELTGAVCIGYFVRPDGVTLILNGEVSGNRAYVDLPIAAYARAGHFTLTIKISGTGFAETLRIMDGSVAETTTGTIADPASEIPSLEELMAVIGDAEAAAETVSGLTIVSTLITGTRYQLSVTKG